MVYSQGNTTIMVRDVGRSVEFYIKTLGLEIGQRHEDDYVEILAPGIRIVIHPQRGVVGNGPGNMSLGFETTNIAEVCHVLGGRGIIFDRQENDANRFAFFFGSRWNAALSD